MAFIIIVLHISIQWFLLVYKIILNKFVLWCIILVGEIFELKAELNSDKKDRKKEAVKKVIASMTVGKDVRY